MDVRTAAIEILTKAVETGNFNTEELNIYLAQLPTMEARQELYEIINLVKSKYIHRDYKPGSADDTNNSRRKSNNISGGQQTGIPTMPHIKEYGGHGPSAAATAAKKYKALSAKNPTHVKDTSGRVVDVLHSSGPRKGKSVFKDGAEKEHHLNEINNKKKAV